MGEFYANMVTKMNDNWIFEIRSVIIKIYTLIFMLCVELCNLVPNCFPKLVRIFTNYLNSTNLNLKNLLAFSVGMLCQLDYVLLIVGYPLSIFYSSITKFLILLGQTYCQNRIMTSISTLLI